MNTKAKTKRKSRPIEPKLQRIEEGVLVPMEQHQAQLPALTNTPDMLIAMALKNGKIGIDVLERLSKLQQDWLDRQAKSMFKQAMTDFQSEVPAIPKAKNVSYKTKTNDEVSYNHAELDRIVETIKPFKKKYNFSHDWKYRHFKDEKQTPMIEVTCIVSHPSGHSESTSMEGEHDSSGGKNNIQQRGSTVTYLQRYTLVGVFGLVTAGTDKDGGKMDQPEQPKQQPTARKPAITTKQLNEAITRIANGEDILQECKDNFTLTPANIKGLEVAEKLRLEKLKQSKEEEQTKF